MFWIRGLFSPEALRFHFQNSRSKPCRLAFPPWVAVCPHQAVAWNDDCQGVRAHGASDGAMCASVTDGLGDFGGGYGLTVGDALEGLPNGLLKCGSGCAAGEVESCSLASQVFLQLRRRDVRQRGRLARARKRDAPQCDARDGIRPRLDGYGPGGREICVMSRCAHRKALSSPAFSISFLLPSRNRLSQDSMR